MGEAKGGSKKLKAIIFGAPGAGKGTYASRLQTKLGVEVIATGDWVRVDGDNGIVEITKKE